MVLIFQFCFIFIVLVLKLISVNTFNLLYFKIVYDLCIVFQLINILFDIFRIGFGQEGQLIILTTN